MIESEVKRLEGIWYAEYTRLLNLEQLSVVTIDREKCNKYWREYKDAWEIWHRYNLAVKHARIMREATDE